MKVNPKSIAPSQDFLKEKTIKYIIACVNQKKYHELPPAPIIREDSSGKYVAIDGHNLIAVMGYLGEDVEVHLAKSNTDGLDDTTAANRQRNKDLLQKFDLCLTERDRVKIAGVEAFDDLVDKYRTVFDEAENQYWSDKRDSYAVSGWSKKPSIFAKSVIDYFDDHKKILELGAGLGQDSIFFASKDHHVVSTDKILSTDLQLPSSVVRHKVDIANQFPYSNDEFDGVYCHLALHYFDLDKTSAIFAEIYRVLKPGGIFAFLVNSTNDPEYSNHENLKDDFLITDGTTKRFFTPKTAKKFAKKFEVILCDDEGETYKDNAKGVTNLVRFVGRKPR